MDYIDDFNEMTGTKYTKESFIKLFNQYFPNGKGNDKDYSKSYKTMYEHALRFAVRSYVFKDLGKNVEISKVTKGLNALFEEQIADYNKLLSVKNKDNMKIAHIPNGGLKNEDLGADILKFIDDLPKTQKEEENAIIKKSFGDIGDFNKACTQRITQIFGNTNSYSRAEEYSHSIDVIRIMKDRLASLGNNYRLAHPFKYLEEKKNIENAKGIIASYDFDLDSIERESELPSGKTSFFKKVEESINGGLIASKSEEKEFQIRLKDITTAGSVAKTVKTKKLEPTNVIDLDF